MKIPNAGGGPVRGSFGIPEHLRPEAIMKERAKNHPEHPEGDLTPAEAEPRAAVDEGFSVEEKPQEKPLSPIDRLKLIGVDFTTTDYNRLFFQGSIEKDVQVGFDPETKRPIMATLKTLTPNECDALDECLAEEVNDLKVTRDGVEKRKVLWTAAFVLVAIDGRPFVKPVMKAETDTKDMVVDRKATARLRKKFVQELSIHLVNNILSKYNILDTQIKFIMGDSESAFLGTP